MSKRAPGTGTVETLPSGRKRARIWLADGLRHDFGPYDTEQEAQDTINALAMAIASNDINPALGMTWAGWLERWQKELQASKAYVGMANVRSICRKRLAVTPFANWPIRRVTDVAIRQWVDALSRRTDIGLSSKQQTLLYARKAFEAALHAGAIEKNPTNGVKVARGLAPTEEPWTYLTLEEQRRAFADATLPDPWQDMVQFAAGCGLRAGEQWNLRLADLHLGDDPHVVVRYGSRKRAPKGRRIRRVPLFGLALAAARRWVARLPQWCPNNPDGLAFPGPLGGRQKVSRLPAEWKAWLKSAGIDRRVRWHDLRHTCGSSLVSGWWGRTWSLQEVRDLLGHKSIEETERYAHIGETALKKAARETGGGSSGAGPESGPRAVQIDEKTSANAVVGVLPRHSPRNAAQVAETTERTTPSVDSAWTAAPIEIGDQMVRAAGARAADEARALGCALAVAVMSADPFVALASAVLAGGPHSLDRALELYELLLRSARASARATDDAEPGREVG
jgi:integrase